MRPGWSAEAHKRQVAQVAADKARRAAADAIPDPTFGELCMEQASGCSRCGAELSGRRKRWCSDACREWWYRHHRWSDARTEAMRRAKHRCIRCGEAADEVDHIIERAGMPLHEHSCLHHQANLRPLCHGCHVTRTAWDAA